MIQTPKFYWRPSPPQGERVLFLASVPDGGHQRCASAVQKALSVFHPSIHSDGADAATGLFPWVGPIVARTYLEMLRHAPRLWDFLYDNPGIVQLTREPRRLFNAFNGPKLKALQDRYRPTAFACTHAVPCGLIAEQKRLGRCDLPLIAIVTDYAVHSYWIYPEVDLYIAANPESRETLLAHGVAPEKIRICGIPVDPVFAKKANHAAARRRLGLEADSPALLVMGGAHGLGPIAALASEVLSLHVPPQLILVAGSNPALKKKLSAFRKHHNVRVYGHASNVSALMDAADLLITKPGGLTCAEALAKGLPMLLVQPIGGQEERNARYLIRHGAALAAGEAREAKATVEQLLARPDRLERVAERCRAVAAPAAALDAADAVAALLRARRQADALPVAV